MTINEFNFEVTDRFDKFSYKKAQDIVNFTVNHIDFLPCLCYVLTTFLSIDSIDEIGRRNENKLKKFIKTFDFENTDNNNYKDKFENIIREAYNIKSTYPNDSNEELHDKLGKIRGQVLECLIEEFVKPRYKQSRVNPNNMFSKGCKIILNGNELITQNRITVDIAGWDGDFGEFYETKVGPKNFSEDVLSLLTVIKNELDKQDINAIVGCVTMVNKEKLINVIKYNKMDMKFAFNESISVLGKEELIELKESPFSMYA